MRKAFTLIEVLVVVAIVSMLTILFIPGINRSLSQNNLANDASLVGSKIESTRLLAASTQQAENDQGGFYGLYVPSGTADKAVYVVRLSLADVTNYQSIVPTGNCSVVAVVSLNSHCIVETLNLSSGVTITNNVTPSLNTFILYKEPSQQVYFLTTDNSNTTPVWGTAPVFKLKYGAKNATMDISSVTGRVNNISYN